MPHAACPKCHRPLPEGVICCAQVRCMWRCRRCFKLATGFAIPYGRCRLCDGELQMFTDIHAPEAERIWAVREAVQAELDAFLFYKLARDQARYWDQRAVLERLCEAEMSVLSDLEKPYHPHLATGMLELSVDEQNRSRKGSSGAFVSATIRPCATCTRRLSPWSVRRATASGRWPANYPKGPNVRFARNLAEKDEGHVALLESELGLLAAAAN